MLNNTEHLLKTKIVHDIQIHVNSSSFENQSNDENWETKTSDLWIEPDENDLTDFSRF